MMRAIRGATTVEHNEADIILKATEQLFKEIIEKNNLSPTDVVSVLISATADINACFPAAALRRIDGCMYVPVTCMQEMDVVGALQKCIRIMVTAETTLTQQEIIHVYKEKAVQLRPDLQN